MSSDPVENSMKAAFSALLKGDLAGRDKHCADAEKALKQQEMDARARAANKIITETDFFVWSDGRCVSSKQLYAAAN